MGISFLAPMLLGAAALVAVPIALHLIMRRKPVPHAFPALRFLQQRALANRRRLQVSHLLLLLLRVAALALLALAFARPVLRGAAWLADGEAPVAAAFVFDTAPRMLLREGNRTRLEQAAAMAKVLFAKLPQGSRVAVLDTGGGAAAFSPTLAAAHARVDRLAAATPAMPLSAAIAAGARLLANEAEKSRTRRELYVFTDCSHGAWDGAAAIEPASDTSILYVDVGSPAPQNFAIESLELGGEQLAAGTPLTLAVSLGRSGPDASRAVAVELLMPDGRYARRAVKPVAWKESASTQVDFEIGGLEPGTRQGRVVIDGADDLEADDSRSFTVAVGAAVPVIVAASQPATRTGLFVAEALAPAGLRRAGTARFAPTIVAFDDLGATDWRAARGIVLMDPPPLPPATWDALRSWVAEGHGLVVWLGPRAGTPERFDSEASRSVLGGRLVRVWRDAAGGNHLAPAALDHPILAAFRRVGDAVPWQDFPVSRHWEFAPDEAAADTTDDDEGRGGAAVVAAYRDGLPAILDHRVGLGTVVVVTTPASQAAGDPEAWNTLATGFEPWPFVILANETLLHAIDTADERNVVAGMPAVLRIDRRDLAAAFVRTPGGDDFPAAVDQKRGTVTVTATEQPGNYTVRAGGDVGGVATGFSANLSPAATDYRRVPAADLAAVLGAGHRIARTETELVRDVNLERVGTELHGWMIILAALAMAADWIAANRFYAPRDDVAAPTAAATFAAGADPNAGDQRPVTPPPVPPPSAPPVPPPVQHAAGRRGPPPLPPLSESGA